MQDMYVMLERKECIDIDLYQKINGIREKVTIFVWRESETTASISVQIGQKKNDCWVIKNGLCEELERG